MENTTELKKLKKEIEKLKTQQNIEEQTTKLDYDVDKVMNELFTSISDLGETGMKEETLDAVKFNLIFDSIIATPDNRLIFNIKASRNITETMKNKGLESVSDIITFIPLESWGFSKFGESKAICVVDYYENELGAAEEGSWEWFIGQDYDNDSNTQNTLKCIAKIASCREDMYILGETDSEKVWEDDLGHVTRAGAEEELVTLSAALEEEKL